MSSESTLQVIGLCRFSYPSEISAFEHSFDDLDSLRAFLYAPQRLEQRLLYMQHVVLPCLRHQTDPAFTFVILVGEQLPAAYLARLQALVADIPQVRITAMPEGEEHRAICRLAMHEHRSTQAETVCEFRLDDDDAVAIDFVAECHRRYRSVAPILRTARHVGVDYCRGVVLYADPQVIEVTPAMTRFWTPGLAIYHGRHENRSILDFRHRQLWQHMPCLSFPRREMYVRGAHFGNDSGKVGRRFATQGAQVDPVEDSDALLHDRFRIHMDEFRAAWWQYCAAYGPGDEQSVDTPCDSL